MVLLFILLLLLAIWAAFKFGGVRKVSAEHEGPGEHEDPGEAGSERFRPGGGSFGGGGASGSWGDDPTESDKRHID